MKTRSIPTFSFNNLIIGAHALAVFDPKEITDFVKSMSSSFAPGTNISISSFSFGFCYFLCVPGIYAVAPDCSEQISRGIVA